MEEIFKPIEGYTGYYVSNMGRVQSLKRHEPVFLTICTTRLGYPVVQLAQGNKILSVYLGRLVLETFLGFPAEPWLCYCHHKNGDILDCRLENLEWLICETTDEYDPKVSHKKGVLKPKATKDRMTAAKYKQSNETIQKAIAARMKTMELRYGYKKRKDYE